MSALPEGHRIGPYRIVRLIGEGGMGAVYEARQEPLDRRVALKTLHTEYAGNKDAVARFFNEAKVLSRLEHPSIVQVSDFGNTPDGTAYLVMEYLRGQSLGRRLGTGDGRLPVAAALQLAWQVADVLAVAHAQGVVHRDLKPDNLMLVEDPVAPGGERVKVLDFGIAKLTRASDRSGVKTNTLAVMGTPMYMSPEQCAGAGGVDAKTDVYSLGCVLYQVLAGRPPFVADGPGQLIGMHLFQTPAPLISVSPKTPPQVAELVQRLLTKDKTQRPSMSAAADDLGRLISKLPGSSPVVRSRLPSSTDPDATRPFAPAFSPSTTLGQSIGQRSKAITQRQRLLVIGLAGLALMGAVVGIIQWRPPRPQPAVAEMHDESVIVAPKGASPAPLSLVTAPPSPQVPQTVRWAINTQPPGAAVLNEKGQIIGTTPWTEEHVAVAGNVTLQLRREGFSEVSVNLDRAADESQLVKLSRVPTASLKAATPKPATLPSSTQRALPKRSGLPDEP